MEGLFSPTTILLHVANTVMLLVALYFLLYKPVKKFLTAREEKVAGELDSAAQNQKQAEELRLERQIQLDGAAQEVETLIQTGEAQGKARGEAVLEAAQKDAQQLTQKTIEDVRTFERNAQRDLFEKAVSMSVEIAGMVLKREITEADHKQLISEFIEKAGQME